MAGEGWLNEQDVRVVPEALGPQGHIYRPEAWVPACRIAVSRFRQIFTWPLALRLAHGGERGCAAAALEATLSALMADRDWEFVADRLDQADAREDPAGKEAALAAQKYAEFVYFHDFMQDTLYGRSEEVPGPGSPVTIFTNRRVAGLLVEMPADGGGWQASAKLERANLHLYRTGALILTLEVDFGINPEIAQGEAGSKKPMSLADVQMIIDRLRRVYAPYYMPRSDGRMAPAGVPGRVWWLDSEGAAVIDSGDLSAEGPEARLARIKATDATGRRNPPVFDHWAKLIAPMRLAGDPDARGAAPLWRHVVDERVPAMSFIALANPENMTGHEVLWKVSRGDWLRLCYADAPDEAPLPYSAAFLDEFEEKACYDRYFPSDAASPNMATRFMFSGYHFAAVGAGCFFENVILHHFRRQYCQMAMAVHIEAASLLATSSRITDVVRSLKGSEDETRARERFERSLLDIQRDFMDFVHLFRFTGVSNQLQPGEMFAVWRRSLHLDALFADVQHELRAATDFVFSLEQMRQTASAMRLNAIATIGVVLGLAFTFVGTGVFFRDDAATALDWFLGSDRARAGLGVTLSVFSGCAILLSVSWGRRVASPEQTWMRRILVLILIVGLVLSVTAVLTPLPFGKPPG